MSQFNGLYIAISGMNAHKAAMEITSHNIANVSAKGYTRQEAVFVPHNPQQSTLFRGQIGRGVTIEGVRRMTDEYLERRIQNEQASAESWKVRAELLQNVESSINSLDLQGRFNSFWESWHGLAMDSTVEQNRFEVQQQAISLINVLKISKSQLDSIESQIDFTMSGEMERVNILAEHISKMNDEISSNIRKSLQPNDLLDRRVGYLKELVGITGASVVYNEDNTVSVSLNISSGGPSEELKLIDGIYFKPIPSGAEVITEGGKIFGLNQIKNTELDYYYTVLDDMAKSLAGEINALHITGHDLDGATGINFFQEPVSGVTDLELTPAISGYLEKIAASGSSPDEPGKTAMEIFNLGDGFSRRISNFLGHIGTAAKNTMIQDTSHQDMLQTMENLKAEVSGVSLDEELANMMRFQRSYQASAQVLSVMDKILETLINIVG